MEAVRSTSTDLDNPPLPLPFFSPGVFYLEIVPPQHPQHLTVPLKQTLPHQLERVCLCYT